MITNNATIINKLEQNTSIEIGVGAIMDINCNTLLSFNDDDFTGANYFVSTDNRQPFKLLFPVDSIVKPFRPERCGIKYLIDNDMVPKEWSNPRATEYKTELNSVNPHRIYYPSKNLYYKYYVTQINTNADLTIRYFDAGQSISSSNKAVPANKIIVKFELAHSTPSSWSIFINGTDVTTGMTKTVGSDGVVAIYYNGTSWTTNEANLSYTSQVTINTLRVTATNPGGNKYLGIIEIAPHWVKDLTDRIVSLGIDKEASSSSSDILPVGLATANSLEMQLNSYGNNNILFRTYDPEETIAINSSYLYLVKKAEVQAFYKIYDAAGTSSDSKGNYFKIPQGSFYLNNWNLSEFGDLSIFALDAAKFLQEVVCPDLLCDDYSAAAVIRYILDSIGFTKYNFNFASSERSVPAFRWWWSDGTKTVWTAIQEICKDIQMSAFFDENNILQFYSRDFVFTKKVSDSSNWIFRDKPNGNLLPNLVSLQSETLPASNNIKILYNSVYIAAYEQSNKSLAEIDKTSFASAALRTALPSTTGTGGYVELDIISIRPSEITYIEALQSYSGFLLINSEIIEYDAIEYEYENINGSGRTIKDITGPADLVKYRGEAKVLGTIVGIRPTGRYRIKKRAACGTDLASHQPSPSGKPAGWNEYRDGILTSGVVSGANINSGNGVSSNDYSEWVYLPNYGTYKRIPI